MQKKLAIILTICALTGGMLACGSKESKVEERAIASAEEAVQASETVDTEIKQGENKEAEKTEDVELKAEPTPEPTQEPTPAPIVYEGVDMESTLPGEEWMLSLDGHIEEPKLIVFNDETNKKVIVEEGQEVEFAANDTLGIYMPAGECVIVQEDNDVFKHITSGEVFTLKEISKLYWKAGSAVTENVIRFNGEDISLTATLIFVD